MFWQWNATLSLFSSHCMRPCWAASTHTSGRNSVRFSTIAETTNTQPLHGVYFIIITFILNFTKYKVQYPIFRIAQSALNFTSLADMFNQDTISASLGSIQLCADYSHINIHHCLQPVNHSYSWVTWGNVDWTNMPKVWHDSTGFEPEFS